MKIRLESLDLQIGFAEVMEDYISMNRLIKERREIVLRYLLEGEEINEEIEYFDYD